MGKERLYHAEAHHVLKRRKRPHALLRIWRRSACMLKANRVANELSGSFLKLAHVLHGALIDAVLLDHLAVVEHIELFGRIFTCEQHDRFLATWVIGKEFRDVVDFVANDAPTIGLR